MIQSMTGFGRGEAANEKYKVTIEMKSVNHRYLDLSVRLPRKLNFYEPAIRNQVKEFAKRGKIDIFVSMEQLQENAESIQYNPQIAAAYLSGISQWQMNFRLTERFRPINWHDFRMFLQKQKRMTTKKNGFRL